VAVHWSARPAWYDRPVTLVLESELDLLFRVLPSETVEWRGKLVARLARAGDKAAAARVKALKRPTPAAWAINQLHFEDRALLDRAVQAAEGVRALHARDGVSADALRAAMAEQRSATSAVVDAALRRLERAGLPSGLAQHKKLTATVQGWLAGAGDEQPGRMTHDLEPGGFEALSIVGSVQREPAPVAAEPPAPTRDEARLERARARVSEAEDRALAAREVVRRRKEERDRARDEASRAAQRVIEAERTLEELRVEAARREAAVVRSERSVDEAVEAQKKADEAAASARAALRT
jgi:hypothetical protein